jgi:subtilisin family serine protease
MRSRRRSELAVIVVLAAIGVAAWLTVRSSQPTAASSVAPQGVSWTGLVGSPRAALPHANRMIVVLRVPSVAQRVATAKLATEAAERRWAAEAFAAQQQVLTQLARHGLATKPDYSYARVIDGFSAVLDPRALPLLEHNPEVAGVFPVRAAYPATIPVTAAGATAAVPGIALPGNDGTGVTIALLDTGVDLEHPYLGGRVAQGIDVVGGTGTAAAQRDPQNRTLVERHGTELAGVLVGSGGPGGMQGVAPGASVIPIRVAGWQPTLSGVDSIYARSDQVIEGLERAVDPNGDGDTHDAARIALLGVVEPFASFPDSPEAQAVDGAGILDMLVVAPAGNDGAAGPLFGSIAGPGGSPAALTVGATDPRLETSTARLVLRQGLAVMADSLLPLLGTTSPAHPLDLQVAERGAPGALRGKAALLPVGPNPVATVRVAARNGAAAVLLYGRSLPAGSIRDAGVPVLGVPSSIARAALKLVRQRFKLVATIGLERSAPNPLTGRLAPFSSRGLTYGGMLAPQLTAPGIAIQTSDPGNSGDGEPAFTAATGTSVSAAAVAGAAALLAQARPGLTASDLASLLTGSARPSGGVVDPGAAAVEEISASTNSLSFGPWTGPGWHRTVALVVKNVSTRQLTVRIASSSRLLSVAPAKLVLAPGRQFTVRVTAQASKRPALAVVTGGLVLAPSGSAALRVPWVVIFRPYTGSLVGPARISPASFSPSDSKPAVLQVVAGRVTGSTRIEIQPVARLDVLLYTAGGTYLGVLAHARDLLPGAYSFSLSGRGPTGDVLPPGSYEIRVTAWPELGGKPSRVRVPFRIE